MKSHPDLLREMSEDLPEAVDRLMDALGIKPEPLREGDEEKPER